jgi:hypothetical protein
VLRMHDPRAPSDPSPGSDRVSPLLAQAITELGAGPPELEECATHARRAPTPCSVGSIPGSDPSIPSKGCHGSSQGTVRSKPEAFMVRARGAERRSRGMSMSSNGVPRSEPGISTAEARGDALRAPMRCVPSSGHTPQEQLFSTPEQLFSTPEQHVMLAEPQVFPRERTLADRQQTADSRPPVGGERCRQRPRSARCDGTKYRDSASALKGSFPAFAASSLTTFSCEDSSASF